MEGSLLSAMPIYRITVGSGANGLTLFPAGMRRYGTNDFLPRRPHRDQGLKDRPNPDALCTTYMPQAAFR
ncbi:hypothetical protein QC761_0082270 [Podospora bellae-mahoneyi]|uniref:Uncharacterized protein n=1 Tax=Podospora bellae-mahoneyi TaxID=2093777 RepID=A0ABR0FGL4_9PEZI|nr:hypothetical protein QC761_0082270 [Podospora bellae-mahoneyi]